VSEKTPPLNSNNIKYPAILAMVLIGAASGRTRASLSSIRLPIGSKLTSPSAAVAVFIGISLWFTAYGAATKVDTPTFWSRQIPPESAKSRLKSRQSIALLNGLVSEEIDYRIDLGGDLPKIKSS
jgi:hypothetical protein